MRPIAENFIGANPVVAMVLAAHVASARRDGVAFDGLPIEGCAGGGPVLKCAGFEVEVQRTAIFAGGENTFGRGGEERLIMSGESEDEDELKRSNLESIGEFRELTRINK